MNRQACGVLAVSLSQEDWRESVCSFLSSEKGNVLTIEVIVVEGKVRSIASESWTSDARSAGQIAESIARWIELRCDVASAMDLEAMISVWDESRPYTLDDVIRQSPEMVREPQAHNLPKRIKATLRLFRYALRRSWRLLSEIQ